MMSSESKSPISQLEPNLFHVHPQVTQGSLHFLPLLSTVTLVRRYIASDGERRGLRQPTLSAVRTFFHWQTRLTAAWKLIISIMTKTRNQFPSEQTSTACATSICFRMLSASEANSCHISSSLRSTSFSANC